MTVAMMSTKTKTDFPKPTEGLMAVLKDYHVVRLPYNPTQYNDMLTWCLAHCQNKFRDIQDSNGRGWYFQNPEDAMMFAMKWS